MRESVKKNIEHNKRYKLLKNSKYNSKKALEYLEVHGNCVNGKLIYGLALGRENRKEEAKEIFEELLDTENRKYALLNLMVIEFGEHNYEQCYEYLMELKQIDSEFYDKSDLKLQTYYCMQALNMPINVDRNNLDYMDSVILNYDDYSVVSHIMYHKKEVYAYKNGLASVDEISKTDDNFSFFADDIDIPELYENVRKIIRLDEIRELHGYNLTPKFYFRYDNVGSNEYGKKNYLGVMVLNGTDRIVTIYPTQSIDKAYLADHLPVFDYFEMLEKANSMESKAL